MCVIIIGHERLVTLKKTNFRIRHTQADDSTRQYTSLELSKSVYARTHAKHAQKKCWKGRGKVNMHVL